MKDAVGVGSILVSMHLSISTTTGPLHTPVHTLVLAIHRSYR